MFRRKLKAIGNPSTIGAGHDWILGTDSSGNYLIAEDDGNDVIETAGGNDSLSGGIGRDTLTGGDGADSRRVG